MTHLSQQDKQTQLTSGQLLWGLPFVVVFHFSNVFLHRWFSILKNALAKGSWSLLTMLSFSCSYTLHFLYQVYFRLTQWIWRKKFDRLLGHLQEVINCASWKCCVLGFISHLEEYFTLYRFFINITLIISKLFELNRIIKC